MSEKKKLAAQAAAPPSQASDVVTETDEIITPDTAKEYLEQNYAHNRNLQSRIVAKYASDMLAGRWRPVGDPIRFNRDGELIDGQHRLKAIESSGVAMKFRVIRGLDQTDIHVIDTGRGRNPGDILKLSGFSHGPLRAAALRMLLTIKDGPFNQRHIGGFTTAEIKEAAFRHPLLGDSCALAHAPRGVRPSMLVAIHYLGANLLGRREAADAYVNVFNTGIPYYEGDAAHYFREKLLRARTNNERMTEGFTIRAAVHTWNLFTKKHPMQVFKIPETVAVDGLDPDLI